MIYICSDISLVTYAFSLIRVPHTVVVCLQIYVTSAGANPGFPVGGAPTLRGERQHTILSKFPKKLQEIEKILGRGRRAPKVTLRSATGVKCALTMIFYEYPKHAN